MVNKKFTPSNSPSHYLVDFALLSIIFYTLSALAEPRLYPTSSENMITDTTLLPGIELYLDVTINQSHFGIARFGYKDEKVWVSAATLKQLHFKVPSNNENLICLNDITEINYHYNSNQQTLSIDAPLSLLDLQDTTINLIPSDKVQTNSSTGALLNYDLYATKNITTSLRSFSEFRLFNQYGLLSSTQQTQHNLDHDTFNQSPTRLDTLWRTAFSDHNLVANVGDTQTRALSWSRSTRIAGIQIGTDYSLQPYIPTAPLAAFYGSATLPSNVELYIDGIKRYSGEVPIGNFTLNSLPNVNGQGDAQIILTDSLGRESVQNISFYNDQSLLREYLFDWSAELGVVRENYAIKSFDYANKPIASTTLRYGVNNHLTASAHSEFMEDLVNLGVESHWIPQIGGGTVSSAIAFSSNADHLGWLYYVGYRWANNRFNFATSIISTSAQYQDVAASYSSMPFAFYGNLIVGYNSEYLGSLNLSYFALQSHHDAPIRYVGLNWYRPINDNLYLSASVNKQLDDDKESILYLTATMLLNNNQSVSISSQQSSDSKSYQINTNRTAPSEGGLGWNITASKQDNANNNQVDLNYITNKFNVSAGFNNINSNHSRYLGASGTLAIMNDHIFASKPITNSFAVISANGLSNIPIRLENSTVGVTNDDGLLLIPSLNSYQKNIVALDSTNLPANIQVKQTSIEVVPEYRAGTLVKFDVIKTHPALVTITDPNGEILPQGSQIQLNGQTNNPITVGFDGMAYFEMLNDTNQLLITYPKGQCYLKLIYPKTKDLIPQIGPLRCSH
ncbi:fimbria/pilus outer membrane usher protein [Providencia manganoxydans]|uniref:fimbria/pilus outer membrane usher protein n=1 Tax=Providencia manganoxydans TaxID=2923283 RepID=UPI0034DD9DF1